MFELFLPLDAEVTNSIQSSLLSWKSNLPYKTDSSHENYGKASLDSKVINQAAKNTGKGRK